MQDGPYVLKDISFEIKSGERVGIGTYAICDFALPRALTLRQSDGQEAEK